MLDKVIAEIGFIPEYKLAEVYNFLHDFRLGLQKLPSTAERIMQFAG